ncbi:MAG TPA: DUF3175 domain-containing protein [Terriglobales bacterium]|nr:DUF3175 domain-containing protein [Terriglobales bacterium]
MATKKPATQYWSGRVTRQSNALDLQAGVFKLATPRAVALSLRRSALASARRKADPFGSAMSMLNFYINRAGKNLTAERRRTLQAAKAELRRLFRKETESAPSRGGGSRQTRRGTAAA